jgi:molybdenum cofactor biosynthesis enzyme MoaA
MDRHAARTPFYHVTTLSNFVKGYDKYQRRYAKTAITQSTFPDQFFLLRRDELAIGVAKAEKLRARLNLPGDRLIVLETAAAESELRRDHASGLGQYVPRNYIDLAAVHYFENDAAHELRRMRVEDVTAQSFETVAGTLLPWDRLAPRSISVLPIAQACQAKCRFCFSQASVSADFQGYVSDWGRVAAALAAAKEAGAERAVITGGGEPTLLKHEQLVRLVGQCAAHFNKTVLITNGHILGRLDEPARRERLRALDRAGLSVLAVSRHHHDRARNAAIMRLDTKTEDLLGTVRALRTELENISPRLICVLQDDGIATPAAIGDYLSWAAQQGVRQVNFKELYVSTGNESAYADRAANEYSARHQVPLRIVHDFAAARGWAQTAALPWGAPVFSGEHDGTPMQVAAYTEPSVYWERTNGIARSWNLMSDGAILASLEDPRSHITLKGPQP